MDSVFKVAGSSDPGLAYRRNEDSWQAVDLGPGSCLLVVCDGMGGMGQGDAASDLSVRTIVEVVQRHEGAPLEALTAALQEADRRVRATLCTGEARPGSTAVAVLQKDDLAYVAWVGDSRAYWVRDGHVLGKTRDHKLVQGLVDAGELTPEEARASNLSNVLVRSIGGRSPDDPPAEIEAVPAPWQLRDGDRILLCSDGIIDLLEDDEIVAVLGDVGPEVAAGDLVDVANRRGGHDNSTAIVGAFVSPGHMFRHRSVVPGMNAEAPTEGFAPSRDLWPSDEGDVDDEDDKATVLGGIGAEMMAAALVPPTPEPAQTRQPAGPGTAGSLSFTAPATLPPTASDATSSAPASAPGTRSQSTGGGTNVGAYAAIGVFAAILLGVGAYVLLTMS